MSLDLTSILDGWPYEPGHLNVRLIEGDDGEPRVQIRLDLGILQMRTEGRPDGHQPDGFDTLLEAVEAQMDGQYAAEAANPPPGEPLDEDPGETAAPAELELQGADEDPDQADPAEPEDTAPIADSDDDDEPGERNARVVLDAEACRRLREEAVQFYHRAVAMLVIEDFDAVVRDTSHNLRLFDLLRDHGSSAGDRASMEGQRPYITMMRARAIASIALRNEEPKAAMLAIDEGLAALKAHYEDAGEPKAFDTSREVEALRSMRESLTPKLPVSQKSELKKRLDEALRAENYELAAILRDELRLLREA